MGADTGARSSRSRRLRKRLTIGVESMHPATTDAARRRSLECRLVVLALRLGLTRAEELLELAANLKGQLFAPLTTNQCERAPGSADRR